MKIKILIILLALLIANGCGTGKQSTSHPSFSQSEFNKSITFPERLGWLKKGDITNYEKDYPGLGYSVKYTSYKTVLDIYIYDARKGGIPSDIRSKLVVNEFRYCINDVFEMERRGGYKYVTLSKEKSANLYDYNFWIAEFGFSRDGLDRYSVLALTVHKQKFFKIRITTLKEKKDYYKDIVNELIDEVILEVLMKK